MIALIHAGADVHIKNEEGLSLLEMDDVSEEFRQILSYFER